MGLLDFLFKSKEERKKDKRIEDGFHVLTISSKGRRECWTKWRKTISVGVADCKITRFGDRLT